MRPSSVFYESQNGWANLHFKTVLKPDLFNRLATANGSRSRLKIPQVQDTFNRLDDAVFALDGRRIEADVAILVTSDQNLGSIAKSECSP